MSTKKVGRQGKEDTVRTPKFLIRRIEKRPICTMTKRVSDAKFETEHGTVTIYQALGTGVMISILIMSGRRTLNATFFRLLIHALDRDHRA